MISVQHLSKQYLNNKNNNIFALKDICVNITQGEIFGVIGRSGAGKSSFIRCLNLLERPSAGLIKINQKELTTLCPKDLRAQRKKMGMIFQHFNLLSSRTALENILLSLEIAGWKKKEAKTRALELLDLVKLKDKQDAFPEQLSGGEKQRVAIARALANHPEVLLCDEATSALDPETTGSILNLLQEINQKLNLTIVLITHELEVIKKIAHRVGVLDQGVLVETGTVLNIFTQPKSKTAQDLIKASSNLDIPGHVQKKLLKNYTPGTYPLLQLCFIGDQVDQPILAALSEKFQVKINLLQAQIQTIGEVPVGLTLCEILGANFSQALEDLKIKNIQVEVLGYV